MADYDILSPPRVGETFNAHIHEIRGGHGIIHTKDSYIDIGPVRRDAVGEWIQALKLPGGYARCNTQKVTWDDYLEKIEERFPHDLPFGPGGENLKNALRSHPPEIEEKYAIKSYHSLHEKPNLSWVEKQAHHADAPPGSIEVGDVHTVVVDRISGGGNAMVSVGEHEFNIGKENVDRGDEVDVEILAEGFAKRLTDQSRNDYSTSSLPDSLDVGDTYTVEIERFTEDDDAIVVIQDHEFNLGSVKALPGMEAEIKITSPDTAECLTESFRPTAEQDTSESPATTSTTEETPTTDSEPDAEPSPEPSPTSSEPAAAKAGEAATASAEPPTDTPSAPTPPKPEPTDLTELRKQAEADAEENVTIETPERTSIPEYTRSTKIRRYVKARADGVCEGCDQPAPFTSKTGKPYLHAHHVHELSDGGSDTIDTVIALCPNCHYRVHHGEEGDTYNQQLIDKLEEMEN